MTTTAVRLYRRSFDQPDETRQFEGSSGSVQLINTEDGGAVGRAVFQPGFKWSEHVKPIAKTDSCQSRHMGYVISGRMKVVMQDGSGDVEYGTGDFISIPPGHDAWTIGEEPCVMIDWTGIANYAKR